jgi:hypothetical protein
MAAGAPCLRTALSSASSSTPGIWCASCSRQPPPQLHARANTESLLEPCTGCRKPPDRRSWPRSGLPAPSNPRCAEFLPNLGFVDTRWKCRFTAQRSFLVAHKPCTVAIKDRLGGSHESQIKRSKCRMTPALWGGARIGAGDSPGRRHGVLLWVGKFPRSSAVLVGIFQFGNDRINFFEFGTTGSNIFNFGTTGSDLISIWERQDQIFWIWNDRIKYFEFGNDRIRFNFNLGTTGSHFLNLERQDQI